MNFFLISYIIILTKIQNYIHLKIDILCDDYCKDILLDNVSILDKINLNTELMYGFQTISFIANPGQTITFKTYNSAEKGGIAVRIKITSNGNTETYLSSTNDNLFSFDVNDDAAQTGIDYFFYDSQNEEYKPLFVEIGSTFGPQSAIFFINSFIEYYFTIPNTIQNEITYSYTYLTGFVTLGKSLLPMSHLITPTVDSSNTYNKLYFFLDDDLPEFKGKLVFRLSGIEIRFNELFNYEEYISYPYNSSLLYKRDIVYFTLSEGDYIDTSKKGRITFYTCPDYCDKGCSIYYECFTKNDENEIENYVYDFTSVVINQILISQSENERILTCYNNNFLSTPDYPDIIDLNYCLSALQNYFNQESFLISVFYKRENSDSNLEITKIVFYDNFFIILTLSDFSICSNDKIFYESNSKQLIYCYESCKTCWGPLVNNCESCFTNNILTSINTCVNVYEQCGEEKSLWLFEAEDTGKIKCLETSNCPLIATNFLSESLECVSSCNYIRPISKCISCNKEQTQIYNSCVDLSDKSKSLEIIQENIVKLLETNPIINTNESTYYISNYPPTNTIVNTNISEINLGECESLLKTKNNIPDEESLILLQIETKVIGQATSKLEYYVYSSDGTLLDLNACDGTEISITKAILNTSNMNLDTAKALAEKGIDVYNINDDFFNDFCNGVSVNDQDLTLQNRIDDVYVNISFCDDGCEYQGINLETNKVICSCVSEDEDSNVNDDNQINENNKKKNKLYKLTHDLLTNINYKIVVCYQFWMNKKYFKNNFGFHFSITTFIILQILFIIYLIRWYKTTYEKVIKEIKKNEKETVNILTTINTQKLTEKNKNEENIFKTPNSIELIVPNMNRKSMKTKVNSDTTLTEQSKENENDNDYIESKELRKKILEMNKIKSKFYNYFLNL